MSKIAPIKKVNIMGDKRTINYARKVKDESSSGDDDAVTTAKSGKLKPSVRNGTTRK